MRMFSAVLFFVVLTGWQVAGHAAQADAVAVGIAAVPGGGVPGGGAPGGGAAPAQPAHPQFKKWPLPAPAKPKKFLPERNDKALEGAALDAQQNELVTSLKSAIEKISGELASAQDAARAEYDAATAERDALAAAKKVLTAAKTLEAYDPNKAYLDELKQLLTKEQWEKFTGQ